MAMKCTPKLVKFLFAAILRIHAVTFGCASIEQAYRWVHHSVGMFDVGVFDGWTPAIAGVAFLSGLVALAQPPRMRVQLLLGVTTIISLMLLFVSSLQGALRA
jgi:hypothetical protein